MDTELLRMVERLLVVLGGIMSVYLGYRLFQMADAKTNSGGKFKVADILEVSLVRVGPGAFFALFGAFVLYTSLHSRVETSSVSTRSATAEQTTRAPASGVAAARPPAKTVAPGIVVAQSPNPEEAIAKIEKAIEDMRAKNAKGEKAKDVDSTISDLLEAIGILKFDMKFERRFIGERLPPHQPTFLERQWTPG